MLLPALCKCAQTAARGEAQWSVVRLALAVEKFRVKQGRWPQQPAEVAPEWILTVPLDPFDGKPLRMKRTERGLIVYSIGPDGNDDGGTPFDSEKKTGDITFTLADKP